jgi:hypothetical protein
MRVPSFRIIALCAAAAIAIATGCRAQDGPPPAQQAGSSGSPLTEDQLDQLVAPVALYPDPLLADVLTAATYPLEVVEADRWIAEPGNSSLNGDALTTTLAAEDWDPSVKSLVPFPDVLQMMDAHLDWMESLGEAFLAQPDDVMNAVQQMRRRAQNAGNLNSPADESVSSEDDMIAISPPPSDVIYVPQYDFLVRVWRVALSAFRTVLFLALARRLFAGGRPCLFRCRNCVAVYVLGLGLFRLAPPSASHSSRQIRPLPSRPRAERRCLASRSRAPRGRALH